MIEIFTIISGLLALGSLLKEIRNKRLLFWSFTLLLVFFYGLRWEMGTDWSSYYDYFLIADTYRRPGFEPAFVLYTTLIREVTDLYPVYLLLTTAIIFIGIYYPIFKMTNGSFLSIFFLTGTLAWYAGSLRQMLACVFFILAVQALFDRRPLKYLLLMGIGMTFHTTVIPFLPMYWLYGLSSSAFMLVFFALGLVAMFARDLVILLSVLTTYIYGTSLTSHIGGTLAQSNPLFGFLRKVLTLAGFFALTLAAKTSPDLDEKQWEKIRFVLMMSSLTLILYYIGTYDVAHVSSRLDIYNGLICSAILIGLLDRTLTRRVNRALLFAFVAMLVYVFYARLGPLDLFRPYSSIFYNYELNRRLY